MSSHRIIYGLCILMVLSGEGKTQQVRFDHFDISNELSQNNIIELLVDDVGYIWAGTLEGLNRFDGYKFEVFKPFPDKSGTISGSEIVVLGNSRDGNIWVVTKNGGLNFFNSDLDVFQVFPDSLFKGFRLENTMAIVETSDGNVWLSDQSHMGIFHPGTSRFESFSLEYSLESMIGLSDNKLVIAGMDGLFELSKTDKKEGGTGIQWISLYEKPVHFLAQDTDSSVYGVSNDQLLLWTDIHKPAQILLLFDDLGISEFSMADILDIALQGNEVWIAGTFPLLHINLGEKTIVTSYSYDESNPYSFQGRRARNLAFDKSGNLWIGTSKHGLNLLEKQKNQFQHYHWGMTTDNTLDIDPIRCICKASSGELWFSFDRFGVGVQHPDGEQELFTRFFEEGGNTRDINRVRSIFQDSEGNIWIGDLEGLGIFNSSRNRIESIRYKFGWDWPYLCYSIKEMDPGVLTITGKPNKIGKVNLSSGALDTIPFQNKGSAISGTIRDIVRDHNDNLWVGHSEGLLKIEFPSFEYSSAENGLEGIKVYSMLSRGDSIWIGTNAGLHLFSVDESRVVKSFLEEDGLASNIIYSVNSDLDGKIWVSTNRGISCYDRSDQRFSNFLENDFFMDDAHFKDVDGELYYGGYTGVISFTPERMSSQLLVPKPIFSEFYLFNQKVSPKESRQNRVILEKSISKTQYLRLHHQENSISFSFTAFPFNFPNDNRYRYKLYGLQDEWTYASGSNRIATFTNLNPGKYILQLSVSTGGAIWSESNNLTIEIVPPFWRKPWFRYGLVFILILSAYLIYLQRISAIKRHNIQLKERVDEQTSELKEQNRQILLQNKEIEKMATKLHEADEAKLRFFTNISHEFRTPLTLIMGHVDQLEGKQIRSSSKAIKQGAMKLLRLVNQFIDLRKLDQGEMQLSVNEFDLVAFTHDIVDSFQVAARKKEIDLQFISTSDRLDLWLDMDKMDKILYNLITNAIKYTPRGKAIIISITERKDCAEVSVADQGIGISKKDIDHIFTRFYRGKDKRIEGHGIGLSFVKSLVDIQMGTISIVSEVGSGTELTLSFSKGKDHYSPDIIGECTQEKAEREIDADEIGDWQPFNPGVDLLVVEDNDDLRDFLKGLLSGYYNVLTADNGISALKLLEHETPELIISDIMMPGMDGITFCEKVKQNTASSHIPVILLTAKHEVEAKVEGFESGADAYVEKPFNSKLLLIQINSILENRNTLKHLFLEHGSKMESIKDKISKADKAFWSGINGYILDNLLNPDFAVDDMSREMNMSRASFYRKFKGLTGISPGNYLRKARLQKASKKLREEDLSINEISIEVGFQSVSHFRKSFKEEFGLTPGAWRKKHS